MVRAVCPCGPCEEVLDLDASYRCPSCGKDLVGKSGKKTGRDDREPIEPEGVS